METNIVTPLQSPDVLTLQNFVKLSLGKVNRSFVRNSFSGIEKFPAVTLNDYIKILQSWQFETKAIKIGFSTLVKLSGPLLAHCNWLNEDKYFIVIQKINKSKIHYISPYKGNVIESTSDFLKQWSGVVLLAAPTDKTPVNLKNNINAESEKVAFYKKNNVKLIDDFLTFDQCKYIIEYAEYRELFERSQIELNAGHSSISSIRTSYSAFLKDRDDLIFKSIYKTTANFFNVPEDHIENIQCVRYGVGQQFKPHFDSGEGNYRLHTVLVYLNDEIKGGETFFPELNLRVKPKTGRALYFLNRDVDNNVILQSLHAGLPVSSGIKYGCNIWIRSFPYNIG